MCFIILAVVTLRPGVFFKKRSVSLLVYPVKRLWTALLGDKKTAHTFIIYEIHIQQG
jgi:hypothetical protein